MSQLLSAPSLPAPIARPRPGKPTWEIALIFPSQGDWSEEEYLALPTRRLVEFTDGRLEILPMPTRAHQKIVAFLYGALLAFVQPRGGGEVLFAPLPVRLRAGKWREPDVIYVRSGNRQALEGEYLSGADLVMEVVSSSDPQRDRTKKRREYAEAGIPEYWIVDPERGVITVLRLQGRKYVVHGESRSGEQAESALLAGFRVDVGKVFAGK